MQFLRIHWRSDPCYEYYGVDGSGCSILVYLSEREHFCPLLPMRSQLAVTPQVERTKNAPKAVIQTDFNPLYKLMSSRWGPAVTFMKSRIQRLSERWRKAAGKIQPREQAQQKSASKVLVYPGVLSDRVGEGFSSMVEKGGPLGELVQWADIITSIYLLGHRVKVIYSLAELQSLIGAPPGKGSCPLRAPLPYDLVYTDYHGLAQLHGLTRVSFEEYKCRFRVVDSFGTEPAFNHWEYANHHGYKTFWGSWNLQPQQYMTMFPHTPDNSFMGFVSEELNMTQRDELRAQKAPYMALVYGKQDYMWQGKEGYLETISKLMEIHGTVYHEPGQVPRIPSFIVNHGLLPQTELLQLLGKAKLFIGLGFPYEGPAPLEAIAHGCQFIQPRFLPPHNAQNNDFYRGKPTSREISSQHPYAEHFIGKPYVWTVDITNASEVLETIRAILQTEVEPYTPYEYSCEGMLERVNAYMTYQ
uniref:alpha-1,6-mannosyl-glycoprotein 6-beta-N-acetylglucosaminyltransferase n=1 Tax=Latimeria chalumnae TaxID=7897 RepID=H3AJR5_LATCH